MGLYDISLILAHGRTGLQHGKEGLVSVNKKKQKNLSIGVPPAGGNNQTDSSFLVPSFKKEPLPFRCGSRINPA